MFTLRIYNFKRIALRELSIPASGLILLDGQTGIGKTTILDAISFVLYDNFGNECYNRRDQGKKKPDPTVVELGFPNGLIITRQRRPNRLQVQGPGILILDDAAQGYLNQLFGDQIIWQVGGYIQQGNPCNFFTMNTAEKLEILQKLSLPNRQDQKTGRMISGPQYFEEMHRKTIELVKEIGPKVQEIETQLKIYTEMYMRIYNQWLPLLNNRSPWSTEDLKQHFEKYQVPSDGNLIHLLQKVKSTVQITTQTIHGKISQEQIKLARNREMNHQKVRLEESRSLLQKELELLPEAKAQIADKETLLHEIVEQISLAQRTERRTQLLTAKAEIQRRLDLIPDEKTKYGLAELDFIEKLLAGPKVEQINEQLDEIKNTQSYLSKLLLYNRRLALVSQVSSLENQLNSYPKSSLAEEIEMIGKKIWALSLQKMICPKCESSLYLNNGKLCETPHLDTSPGESVAKLNQQKAEMQRQEMLFQQRGHLEKQFNQAKLDLQNFDLANDLNGFNVANRPRLAQMTSSQLEMMAAEMTKTKGALSLIPAGINPSEEKKRYHQQQDRMRLQRDLDNFTKEINALPEAELPGEIASLEVRKREIQNEILELRKIENKRIGLSSQLDQLNRQIGQIITYPDDENTLTNLQQELERFLLETQQFEQEVNAQIQFAQLADLMKKHQETEGQYKKLNFRLASLQKIRSTLITAEYIILDNFLEQLNADLAEVIEPLFPVPASLTLRSMKQLKTDDRIKPSINYEIVIDGVEFNSINKVSGGEQSRISLALALVFSQYNNAPFFLLDESLSTLNAGIKESTMKVIRQNIKNKVVIAVNHDTTNGVYDSVIDLK